MIRISNLSLPVDGDLEQLRKRAARALGMEEHPPRTIEELEQRIKGEKNMFSRVLSAAM